VAASSQTLPCIGPQRREVGIVSAADDSAAAAVGTDPFSLVPLLRMGLLLLLLLLLSLDAFLLFATCARSVSIGRTLGDGPGCALDVGRSIEDLGEPCVGKNGSEEARAGFASLVPSGWRTSRGRFRHRRLTTESLANMMRKILSGGQTGGKEAKARWSLPLSALK
jgi:hypothetical protein